MPLPLSLCMIVRDEEDNLSRCLEAVRALVSEIVVVDTGSTDRSAGIAAAAGAHVESFAWNDDFADARNFSLSFATQPWVLVLDADEIIEISSCGELPALLNDETLSALEVTIDNLNDRGPAQSFSVIRIFRNSQEIRFDGRIHEGVAADVRRYNERHRTRVAESGVRIEHHGYLSAEIARKGERNLQLIRAQLEQKPDDLYLRMKEYEELEKLGRREQCDARISEAYSILRCTPPARLAELPFAPMVAANYAQIRIDAGAADEALEAAEWSLARHLDEPWALHFRALAHLRLGHLEIAEAAFRHNLSLRIRPLAYYVEPGIATWLAWFHLAEISLARKNADAAADALERCRAGNPEFVPARRLAVDIALLRGETKSAVALIIDMLKRDETDLWALVNGARILAALSMTDKAEEWLRRALRLQPDLPEAHDILEQLGVSH